MAAVIHKTPGLIPVEAFTIAGLSAKPNSINPIGKFGTGLKYSIAVLVRMDIKVTLFIGHTEYVFYKKKRQFRGKDYFAIRMKKRNGLLGNWSYHEMPFTTEYGKYWELWQVFRELHANTLDEGGETYKAERRAENDVPDKNTTYFVIEDSRYVDVFHERDRIFLPDGLKERTGSEAIQVLDRPSQHIYFRGMRIMDLKKKAQFTYNFLSDVDLTEDRTAKHPSLLEAFIVGMMQQSEDKSFLQRTVSRAPKDSYERGLHHGSAFSSGYGAVTPSVAYLSVAKDSDNPTVKEVWDQRQPTVPSACSVHIMIPKPSLSEYEVGQLVDIVTSIHVDSSMTVNGAEQIQEEILF